MQDLSQLLLVVLEILLDILPGHEVLGLLPFLLLHKVLPDILKVLRLHNPQLAAGLLHAPEGRLHLGLLPHEEPPHHDGEAQPLVLAQGLADPLGAGDAGAGGHVPGDIVAGTRLARGQDGVEKGHLGVGGRVLVLQVAPARHRLLALRLHHVAQEGFVPARAVLHVPELEFEEDGWEAFPEGEEKREGAQRQI